MVDAALEASSADLKQAGDDRVEVIRRQLEESERRAEAAAEMAAEERSRAEAARQELRQYATGRVEARDAELRQAQHDVLRSLAELVDSLRDASVALSAESLLAGLVTDASRRLQSYGVDIIGTPGSEVSYDRRVHEPLDIADKSPVEVVSPAYVLRKFDTPLVYGRVRPIRAGGNEGGHGREASAEHWD
jgi:hypothetical protein